MSRRNKNISKKIPNGRTLQTRDEFFEGKGTYRKPGYENKGYYRQATVVDSNRKGDLAIVKLTTSGKGREVLDRKKSKYRPYVETKDDEGMPIHIGAKFIENSSRKDLSKRAVAEIKKRAFRKSRQALENRKKVRLLKGRKK